MPTPTNLADFLASNIDAVEWRSARDGDVIRYLDPQRRETHPFAYVIDGVPMHERGNIVAWTKRIDDMAIPEARERAIKREFACTVFQVWRRFPTPDELSALSRRPDLVDQAARVAKLLEEGKLNAYGAREPRMIINPPPQHGPTFIITRPGVES